MNDLPTLNAFLNTVCTALLIAGFVQIRRGDRAAHKRLMLMALASSAAFLVSYTIYHANVGSVPYPYFDWTRPVYFAILIPHIILAAVMAPMIVIAVTFALRDRIDQHKKIVKWVFPVWIFVSISGVTIYGMLYLR